MCLTSSSKTRMGGKFLDVHCRIAEHWFVRAPCERLRPAEERPSDPHEHAKAYVSPLRYRCATAYVRTRHIQQLSS